MSSLEEHEREQALITALFEAEGRTPGNGLGLVCPGCGRDDSLRVVYTSIARLIADGSVDDESPYEWGEDSPMFCGACGFSGKAADFEPDEPAPRECPSNHWNDGDDICADCGADLNPSDDPREWTINMAQNVRVYGSVKVMAPSLAEAVALVDHKYVLENFQLHGGGDDDFDYTNATAVTLIEASRDDDGTDTAPTILDIELPDE